MARLDKRPLSQSDKQHLTKKQLHHNLALTITARRGLHA
jgi:hypothetical protein